MSIEVEAVRQVTDELVEACRRLLPQLSSAAAVLDADELARIVDHQANTLLVARNQGIIVGMLTLVAFRCHPASERGSRMLSSIRTHAAKASELP
jgi:hypothetical protein